MCIVLFFYLVSRLARIRSDGSDRNEGFENPLPHEIFKKLRNLLDKYDKPEVWDHAVQISNKSPVELARIHLGEEKESL